MNIDSRQVVIQAITPTNAAITTGDTLEQAIGKAQGQLNAIPLTPTAVKTGAYTASAGELVKTDATSGNVPVTLPTAPGDKTRVAVKMIAVSGTNTTTIAVGGTDVFNKAAGSTSISLTLLNQGLIFQYESATGIWNVTSGDIPLSQLDARYATASGLTTTNSTVTANTSNITKILTRPSARVGSLGDRRIAGFGSRPPFRANTVSDGTQTVETSRFQHKAIGNLFDIAVVYSSMTNLASTTTTGTGDRTLTASIEYPAATFTQITFNNGSTSALLHPNSKIITDNVMLEIPDGASFWVRTCVTVVSGIVWEKQWLTNTNYSEGVTAGSDVTMSGTITNSSTACFGPTAVLGNSTTNKGVVAFVGDSISAGTNDSGFATTYPSQVTGGIFYRAFTNQYPALIMNLAGQQLSFWTSSKFRLSWLLSTCHYFICEDAINDISGGATLATVQAGALGIWETFRACGVYGYQTTITPKTTSTDSWATTTNQTKFSGDPVRLTYNAWIRDGAPINVSTRAAVTTGDASGTTVRAGDPRHPLLGYFEVADIVESARDSGLWKVGYTIDGLHGTSTSYPLMAAAIDTTKFLLWS